MTEIFSSLYGQPDSQGPAGPSALGFGSGKPQVPQNMGPMCFPHQMMEEGAPVRKPAAMNEPFYLLRELPSETSFYIDFAIIICNKIVSVSFFINSRCYTVVCSCIGRFNITIHPCTYMYDQIYKISWSACMQIAKYDDTICNVIIQALYFAYTFYVFIVIVFTETGR